MRIEYYDDAGLVVITIGKLYNYDWKNIKKLIMKKKGALQT